MKVPVGIHTGNVDSAMSKEINAIWDNFFYS